MRSILVFSMLACLMMACQSGKHFTSRKYMSGRYVSGPARAHHVKALDEKEGRIATTTTFHAKANLQPLSGQDLNQVASTDSRQSKIPSKKNPEIKPLSIFRKNKVGTGSHKSFKNPITTFLSQKIKPQKGVPPEQEKSSVGSRSVAATILGILGFVIDIIGFALAVTAMDYSFLLLLIVGLIFGILGMIFGIQGIHEYKSEKEKGNGDKKILVFGILGLSFGIAAIAAALFLSGLGALIISFAD